MSGGAGLVPGEACWTEGSSVAGRAGQTAGRMVPCLLAGMVVLA